MDNIPESAASLKYIKAETSPRSRVTNDKDTGDTIKDKLKNKLKDLLKEKFKPKPVAKTKSRKSKDNLQGSDTPMKEIARKQSKTSLENSEGRENNNTFTKTVGYGETSPRQEGESLDFDDNEEDETYLEDCSEDGDYYEGSEFDSADEYDSDDTGGAANASNIINVINNIFTNKDSAITSSLTLPFFGTFPRTYAEFHTILQGRKLANQLTTTDTAMLAQLKSLNSVSFSA